jgi:hypothetical protein
MLQGSKTKENIMGFFNPMPAFMKEHDTPVLCIVYKKPQEQGETIFISYFKDDEDVDINIQ